MPQRAVNAFDRLAPDQRAAVELVARGRSYGELAGMLGISEVTVRDRARGGLEALAPDLPPPARAGEVADWLLGQAGEPEFDAATRRWAETVAAPLRELPGAKVPALPEAKTRAPAQPGDAAERKRPEAAARSSEATAQAAAPPSPPPARSSRLGGFILIGVALVAVAAVLVFVLTRSDDSGSPAASAPPPTPTAGATSTPSATANDIVLTGPAGSKAIGLMRLFKANDNTVRFALAAQGVPPNTGKSTYSIWFTKKDGSALRLGVAQKPVGKNGQLTTAGPRNEDVSKFPQWFVTYDSVLVSEDASPSAKKPGKVVLSGALPHSSG
jgi:hypothetical protein